MRQTDRSFKLKGFTLIELLIVVAIIAILAAIAVPNFLEAQTRAKVTRSLANMRNTTTALEAYRIDNRGALPAYRLPNYWWIERYWYHIGLSTPVSYMTTPPEDIFWKMYGSTHYSNHSTYYYFHRIYDNNIMHAILANPDAPSCPGIFDWALALSNCSGQGDPIQRINVNFGPMFTKWGKANANYVITGWGPNYYTADLLNPYDPSNGTVSMGMIYYYN